LRPREIRLPSREKGKNRGTEDGKVQAVPGETPGGKMVRSARPRGGMRTSGVLYSKPSTKRVLLSSWKGNPHRNTINPIIGKNATAIRILILPFLSLVRLA